MNNANDELRRLRQQSRDAWESATSAGALNPKSGTWDWDEWQRLVSEALAANDAYVSRLVGPEHELNREA